MIIIGITGTLGAGKGTIVEHLVKKYGFVHYSVRDFLIEEIKRRGLPVNRDMTTMVANDLRTKHHPGYLIEQLYNEAKKVGTNAIIESVRALGELELLRNKGQFYLFAVDADPTVRYERISKRKSELDKISFEKFLADEQREMENTDPTKGNIRACIEKADFVFTNNGNFQDLEKSVDGVLHNLLQ